MTDRLEEIAGRLEAATPGPWAWQPYGDGGKTLFQVPAAPVHELNILKTVDDWPPSAADAEFIAHAPSDIAWLLDEVGRLRAMVLEADHARFDAENPGTCLTHRDDAERGDTPESVGQEVSDGMGGTALRCGPECDLAVVRPGKFQCNGEDAACPDYDNCANCGCNLLPWEKHGATRNGECVIVYNEDYGR